MDTKKSKTYEINDLISWYEGGELNISPKYQRNPVWDEIAKSFLIDTIMRNYPMPPLFFRQTFNLAERKTKREVIDGQQRSRAIIGFYNNEFPILKRHNEVYGGCYFKDLDPSAQEEFLRYNIFVDTITETDDSIIFDIFARMNSNAANVNKQEVRNAKYWGDFKTSVYTVASKVRDFFIDYNIFTSKMDCNNKLTIQRIANKREMDNYTCATYRKKKKGLCSPHRILVSRLEQIVLDDIRKVSEYVFLHEQEFITHYLNRSQKEVKKMQAEANSEIVNANKRCDEINKIIRKLYEDNVSGRITDERFDYLSKSYEVEQKELQRKIQELKEILAIVDNDNEKLAKFIRIVKQYTEIEELTPDILHSFVDRIYIGETEVYEGQKFQDIKIVYNLVGAIDLPQYAM